MQSNLGSMMIRASITGGIAWRASECIHTNAPGPGPPQRPHCARNTNDANARRSINLPATAGDPYMCKHESQKHLENDPGKCKPSSHALQAVACPRNDVHASHGTAARTRAHTHMHVQPQVLADLAGCRRLLKRACFRVLVEQREKHAKQHSSIPPDTSLAGVPSTSARHAN